MKSGNYAEACAAFELSLSLERAVGTHVNLAECYAKLGRTASAWLAYREAASAAQNAGETARATEARDRAAKLEPFLCKLVVKVPSDAPAAMVVRRDGTPVDRLLWGVGVPVDPGEHRLSATSGGEEEVTRTVTVQPPPANAACPDTIVELPSIQPAANASPPIAPIAPLAPRPSLVATPPVARPSPPADGSSPGSTRRGLAVAVGGLGLVGVGIGTGFGVDAISKKSAAACTDAGCTIAGRTEMRAAGSSADVATVAITSGLVVLAAGTILWLTAPSSKRVEAAR
jgi:serine/threonine-protein kinase